MRIVHTMRRITAASLLVALAACSGGGGSHAVPTGSAPSNTTPNTPSSATTRTLNPSSLFTSNAKIGAAATNVAGLSLHVVVNMQNAAGLAAYAQAVSNPASGSYRHFLTASQIGSQYGATAADYQTVANYFASYGLKVGGWPQRLSLLVAGPRTAFEKALGTTFAYYHDTNGHVLIAPSSTITFAKPLPVTAIADAIMAPASKHLQYVHGTPSGNLGIGNTPQQEADAFDFTGAYAAGYTGAGVTIGIIGTGPISAADFPAYRATFNVAGSSTVTEEIVQSTAAASAGGSPTSSPPPVTAYCTQSDDPNYPPSESPTATCNPEDGETQIDTEQSASLARDASVRYYLAYVPDECSVAGGTNNCTANGETPGDDYQGLAESDDEIQQAIADNNGGTAGPDILSLSYGGPEVFPPYSSPVENYAGAYNPTGLEPAEFAALAAEGVAVFVSSGDQGAQACSPYTIDPTAGGNPCVSYPSDDENVTSVGGVFVPLNNAGQYLGPITAWGEQTFSSTGQGGASGGGVSSVVPQPPWQTGANIMAGGRNVPDLSLEGDPNSGVAVIMDAAPGLGGETVADYGGTSVAAPQMAAMWALVLQACSKSAKCATAQGAAPYRLGNAAPYFYKIYNDSTTYANTFYDVTFGDNGIVPCQQTGSCTSSSPTPAPGYYAGTGYDLITGIGVPFARHLITAVTGQ